MNKKIMEQTIIVILTESKTPVLHTLTIGKRVSSGICEPEGKFYRRLLSVLHDMHKRGLLYYWHEPLVGSTWMLKSRDVMVSFSVSGRAICLGELPF